MFLTVIALLSVVGCVCVCVCVCVYTPYWDLLKEGVGYGLCTPFPIVTCGKEFIVQCVLVYDTNLFVEFFSFSFSFCHCCDLSVAAN